MIKKYITLFLVFFLMHETLLANVSFDASVNRSTLAANQTFELTFTLTDARGSNFQPPPLDDFTVLRGPVQSSRVHVINNQMSQIFTYAYVLRPKSTGEFTIRPATIMADGNRLESNPITITVTEATQEQQEPDPLAQIPDNLYLRLNVNKTEVYVGEQLTASFKLYNRLSLSQSRYNQMPTYSGFWVEELDVSDRQTTAEIINGTRFEVTEITRVALYPQRAGTLKIEPMELATQVRIQVPRQSRSFFDRHFSYQNVPYEFKSNAAEITVKPLPSQGRPASFKGMVGNFNIETNIDRQNAEVNDAITFSVKLSGSGNWQNLTAPKPEFSSDFEVFDPKVSRSISTRREILSGHVQYDFLLIPRRPGTFKIPPMIWSYFDPQKESYVELKTDEITLHIEGDEATTGITGLDRREIELLAEDIRYIQTGDLNLHEPPQLFIRTPLFLGLYFSPVLFLFLGFIFRKSLLEKQINPVSWKKKNAYSIFKKQLNQLRNELTEKGTEKVSGSLLKSIAEFVGNKSGTGHPVMEKDAIESKLKQLKVSDRNVKDLLKLIEEVELSVYAPAAQKSGLTGNIDHAELLIKQINEEAV